MGSNLSSEIDRIYVIDGKNPVHPACQGEAFWQDWLILSDKKT